MIQPKIHMIISLQTGWTQPDVGIPLLFAFQNRKICETETGAVRRKQWEIKHLSE